MSFDESERSNFEGNTIALYEFSTGSKVWRYCTDAQNFVMSGVTYLGVAASDGGSTQSGDAQNDDMVITLPRNADFCRLFIGTPPSEEIWATVRRVQRGDTEAPIHWIGTVASAKDIGFTKVEFTCRMLTASFNRNGLRLAWGRQCPHALYDRNCQVNKATYAVTLQVESLTGNTVRSAALSTLSSSYLSNGFFEWEIEPGLTDRRPIETHTGSVFSVLGITDGLEVGDWITVYPGCNRTTSHCVDKFNNLSNYGGVPALPGKSPFDGDPVF